MLDNTPARIGAVLITLSLVTGCGSSQPTTTVSRETIRNYMEQSLKHMPGSPQQKKMMEQKMKKMAGPTTSDETTTSTTTTTR